ncbi:AprI/Inh family metalloprotease inhibitor [Mesorhizobium sp. KR2-14]|uniref:AprI/Inh family metalloprotease inhibitor n=1 Tax=Mesorhizobium sp. KR2-14 TaxID=3156610 RepID=UPI0032B5E3F8
MRSIFLGLAVAACLQCGGAFAEEAAFDQLHAIDIDNADPEFVSDMFGPWTISNAAGDKHCMVVLKRELTIGGMELELAPDCPASFPVLDDITAWRLLEGWAIDLVDAERRTRIHFETPDDIYVAFPDTDGVFTIQPAPKG